MNLPEHPQWKEVLLWYKYIYITIRHALMQTAFQQVA
jgi:hypothetical protein